MKNILWLIFFLSFNTMAASSSKLIVNVQITLVNPPCIINDNNPIEINFDNVMTNKVDGNSYRKPINYTLDCGVNTLGNMRLQIEGDGADFDKTVLYTNIPGLGIKLQNGSDKLNINTWLRFNSSKKPELWAVPIKKNGASLNGGEFTASATMKVTYI